MTTTPAAMPRKHPHPDLSQIILNAIRARGGVWTSGRIKALLRSEYPTHVYPSTIRRHLRVLHAAGHLEQHGEDWRRSYTLRTVCRCDEPGADPYACEAEPEDCSGHFSELNPHDSGARPVNEPSAEVSRSCPVCSWRTSVWHVDDGSAEAELHDHVTRRHDGGYEDGHYKKAITA
jgi:hypothetical protein